MSGREPCCPDSHGWSVSCQLLPLGSNAPWVHKPRDKQDSCEGPSFGMSTPGSSSGGTWQEERLPCCSRGWGWGVGVRNRWSLPTEHTDAPAPLVPSSCLTPTPAGADHLLPHLHCRVASALPSCCGGLLPTSPVPGLTRTPTPAVADTCSGEVPIACPATPDQLWPGQSSRRLCQPEGRAHLLPQGPPLSEVVPPWVLFLRGRLA